MTVLISWPPSLQHAAWLELPPFGATQCLYNESRDTALVNFWMFNHWVDHCGEIPSARIFIVDAPQPCANKGSACRASGERTTRLQTSRGAHCGIMAMLATSGAVLPSCV